MSDSAMSAYLKPWSDSVAHSMNQFICISDSSYPLGGRNALLGGLIAGLGLEFAEKYMLDSFGFLPHCAVFNFGGLRNSLPSDSIFYRDVFECIPFDNEMIIAELTGQAMDSLLNIIALKGGDPVAGLTMGIAGKNWERASIRNLEFDARRHYWVVINDYMWKGGDGYPCFAGAVRVYHTGVLWRNAVIIQMRLQQEKNGKIIPPKGNAIERMIR